MLAYIQYNIRLSRLRRVRNRILTTFDNDRKDARKKDNHREELESIDSSEQFEIGMNNDEIAHLKTVYHLRLAHRYDVPVSQADDWWEKSRDYGWRQLTAKGLGELRSAIRDERNARWAYWELRLKVVGAFAAAITGAAGALIGLIAIWGK